VLTGCDDAFAASHASARSAAFAAVAVPVTLVGHVAAGGHHPDEAALLLGVVLTALGHRLVLAGRERSAPVLVAALAVAQAGLHLLFGGAGHGSGPPPMTSAGAMGSMDSMPGMVHAAVPTVAGGAGPSVVAMLVGHGLAAIVLGAFLRMGERLLWAAARRAVRSAGAALHRVVAAARVVLQAIDEAGPTRSADVRWVPADRHSSLRRRLRAMGGRLWRGPPSVVV
jgi:hypothetical protein